MQFKICIRFIMISFSEISKVKSMASMARQLSNLGSLIIANNEQTTILSYLNLLIVKVQGIHLEASETQHFSSQGIQSLKTKIKKVLRQNTCFKNQIRVLKQTNSNLKIDLEMAQIELQKLSRYKRMQQYEFAKGEKPFLPQVRQQAQQMQFKQMEIQCDILTLQTFEKMTQLLKHERSQNQALNHLIVAWRLYDDDNENQEEVEGDETKEQEYEDEQENMEVKDKMNISYDSISTQIQENNQLTDDQTEREQRNNHNLLNQSAQRDVDAIVNNPSLLSWMRIKSEQFLGLLSRKQPTITTFNNTIENQ